MSKEMAKVAVVLLMILAVAKAKLHVVGDSHGWNMPDDNPNFYSSWSQHHRFAPGDILEFKFVTGESSLARVRKEAYESCNATDPLYVTYHGPANYTLNDTNIEQSYYFICDLSGHCPSGQKLAINTGSSSGNSPDLAPNLTADSPFSAMPPSDSAACSTTAFSLIIILVSIFIALWF